MQDLFWPLLLLACSLLFSSCLVGALILFFTLLRAQVGYLFLVRIFCRCSSSSFNSCWVEHTALALWGKVLTTLYLAAMVWWLSHCRYKSVCIVFLYTFVLKLPSEYGVTKVSKKTWIHLPCVVHSKLDLLIYGGDVTDEAVLLCLLDDNKGVINKSSPQTRGVGDVLMAFFSNASIYRLAIIGLRGEPMAAPSVCS